MASKQSLLLYYPQRALGTEIKAVMQFKSKQWQLSLISGSNFYLRQGCICLFDVVLLTVTFLECICHTEEKNTTVGERRFRISKRFLLSFLLSWEKIRGNFKKVFHMNWSPKILFIYLRLTHWFQQNRPDSGKHLRKLIALSIYFNPMVFLNTDFQAALALVTSRKCIMLIFCHFH